MIITCITHADARGKQYSREGDEEEAHDRSTGSR